MTHTLLPLFVKLEGRRVLVVGGGPVAAAKVAALKTTGAHITVVAPQVVPELQHQPGITVRRRAVRDSDLAGAWFVVSAASAAVNRRVARAAGSRHVFINAVDDPPNASAYLGGTLRRDGVTVAVSTDGRAPALAGLLREAIDALLPRDLEAWLAESDRLRAKWRRDRTPMTGRRPELARAILDLYGAQALTEQSS
jgi:uroporphyrin-III C-methyltransferase/precorrin-2 dehydrogenase/sirohydrochlorin ferrochelatase